MHKIVYVKTQSGKQYMYLGDKESFKIGDIVNKSINKATLQKYFGIISEKDLPTSKLLEDTKEKWDVYHINYKNGGCGNDRDTVSCWSKLLGENYVTSTDRDAKDIVDIIPELVNNTFTLEEPTNLDYGYQGKFKRGIFDVDLLNIAIKRHNLIDYNVEYNLVLTHMDCVKHDYYFLNKEEIYGGSVDSFLIAINNNLSLKFSRNIYSYSE